ncbi:MAG TPA: MBL fold metallo-hydrolase [Chthoniobacterales bacterium]|nr:MBL fold metallo-hydrolase [Chthoniobacterales bacterium]
MESSLRPIAPDVGWLPISFANVYFIGRRGGPWVLVDTGVPGRSRQIIGVAEARFGRDTRPEAIVLTHGHFDHAGNAGALAEHWNVPVYAHPMELPYLTGRSAYPPPDPTTGGAIAFLSRFMPSRSINLGGKVRELAGEHVPGLPDWEWIATPGHSPGHVSLVRGADRVLLAGDAFATMDMESWTGLLTKRRVLARAGAPFNCDWEATQQSVNDLAKLRPNVVGAGHGIPMTQSDLPARLQEYAARFRPPRRGRYVREAARTDENGILSLPPAPFDPVPFATAAGLMAVGIVLGAGLLEDEKKR